MANKGHSIANAQGFFMKHDAEVVTDAELEECVDEHMDIVCDFFDKKHQPTDEELTMLRSAMLSKTTKRGIDNCFREFINNRI